MNDEAFIEGILGKRVSFSRANILEAARCWWTPSQRKFLFRALKEISIKDQAFEQARQFRDLEDAAARDVAHWAAIKAHRTRKRKHASNSR